MEGQFTRSHPEVLGFDAAKIDAWKGGMSTPQFSKIDINLDGEDDLVIFDRNGGSLLTYLWQDDGQEYGYAYTDEYHDQWPTLRDWALLRDYDGDGIMDIYTQTPIPGVPGMAVYRGSLSGGDYRWDLVEFPDATFDVLQIPAGSSTTNLYSSNIDLPAIADMDGDGDLDIVSFESNGGFIYYYKCMSVERYGNSDALEFILEDRCWGGVFESDFNQEITLSSVPGECATPLTGEEAEVGFRHSGSTLLALDEDNNGLLDLLIGDLASPGLILLSNDGSLDEAYVEVQEINFPGYNVPVDIPDFVASFYVDINNDGRSDLIASPNGTTPITTAQPAWYFEDVADDGAPDFSLQQKDLFIEYMLDFGIDAAPAFIDYDSDGLMDLIVGTSGSRDATGTYQPSLYLLLNVGTTTNPIFELEDDDFGGLAAFKGEYFAYTPSAGDLDGDGDDDILVGTSDGTLIYLQNLGDIGGEALLAAPIVEYADIDVNNFSSPSMADINQDGLMDIIVGERNGNVDGDGNRCGNLNYYQNLGEPLSPSFDSDLDNAPNSECLGNVLVERSEIASYGASPAFYFTGTDYILLVGSDVGTIHLYDSIVNNSTGPFALRDESFGDIDEGFRTHVALGELDGDGLLEMVVGNNRGGLSFFTVPISDEGVLLADEETPSLSFNIFPNPSSGTIHVRGEEIASYEMYTSTGIRHSGGEITSGEITLNLVSGIYFVVLSDKSGRSTTEKIIVY